MPNRAHINSFVAGVASLGASAHCLAFTTPEPTELIDQQRCMFCHKVDTPFRAPSFQQIADRYRDVPGASDMLAAKLRAGGKAHWGAHWSETAMPSAVQRGGGPLSRDDAGKLVQWVLSQ
ncbi:MULTISPECIES: c-type cytochrome [unclassified Caballeronia]|uniref:c-type cytochrome n=1 Tax=unclassified Caballeronia TaxID=2646786 RepID=UPI002029961A|nr:MULTISPECIES: c-type cytochrome [unclassified Caballeronia]